MRKLNIDRSMTDDKKDIIFPEHLLNEYQKNKLNKFLTSETFDILFGKLKIYKNSYKNNVLVYKIYINDMNSDNVCNICEKKHNKCEFTILYNYTSEIIYILCDLNKELMLTINDDNKGDYKCAIKKRKTT